MKALTLTQPWASLVALNEKGMETRSWGTKYRGPLAIHSAKRYPTEARRLACGYPFMELLASHDRNPDALPRGVVLATCQLINCIRIPKLGAPGEVEQFVRGFGGYPFEASLGDYSAGRWAWILADIRPLAELVPAKGALGLWEWDGAAR